MQFFFHFFPSLPKVSCNLLYLDHCGWSYYCSHLLYHNFCLVFCIFCISSFRQSWPQAFQVNWSCSVEARECLSVCSAPTCGLYLSFESYVVWTFLLHHSSYDLYPWYGTLSNSALEFIIGHRAPSAMLWFIRTPSFTCLVSGSWKNPIGS